MFLVTLGPAQRAVAETTVLCMSIAAVESGNDYKAVGDDGRARGAWQMHKAAWETANHWRMSKGMKPWSWDGAWTDKKVQKEMAFAYVSWLRDELEASGKVLVGPREIYIAYSWGLTNYVNAGYTTVGCPEFKVDAADRVANIYGELMKGARK